MAELSGSLDLPGFRLTEEQQQLRDWVHGFAENEMRPIAVERWHRDAKVHDIFEGTEQIQQLIIARTISDIRIS